MFTLLLAAYKVLLSRYTGQTDICVGSPTTGRTAAEVAGLIGYFVNPVVFRGDLTGSSSFLELLERERAVVLGALEHQEYPFAKLVERLKVARDPSRSAVFQTMFVFDRSPLARERGTASAMLGHATDFEMSGMQLEVFDVPMRATTFELSLIMEDAGDYLTGFLRYNTDLFATGTIERLTASYQRLLEEVAVDPSQRIDEIPLLSEQDRQQSVVEWNATATPGCDVCLQELFETQVRRSPDATALICGDEQLTYADSNRQANQLAHHLRRLGVGPESLIGICLPRSLETIIAMLAVLKSGGAYVPMDHEAPAERIAHILAELGHPLVLSKRSTAERLADGDSQLLLLDRPWPTDFTQQPTGNPPRTNVPDNAAYVLYTSGSTGRPKGVIVSHRGLVNYVNFAIERFDVAAGNGSTVHSSIAMDLGNTGLIPPLLTGKPLQLLPESDDPEALARAIVSSAELAPLKLTPSHLQLLNGSIRGGAAAGRIRHAGHRRRSAPHASHLAFWRQHAPATRIFNRCGTTRPPSAAARFASPPERWRGRIPIGRPEILRHAGVRRRTVDCGLSRLGCRGALHWRRADSRAVTWGALISRRNASFPIRFLRPEANGCIARRSRRGGCPRATSNSPGGSISR